MLIAFAVIYAPIAAAQHIDFGTTSECADEHVLGSAAEEQPASQHHDHDSHVHGCGPCHVHLLDKEHVYISMVVGTKIKLKLPLLEFGGSISPDNLLRPPIL